MPKDFQKLVQATNKQNSQFNQASKTNKFDMAGLSSAFNKPKINKFGSKDIKAPFKITGLNNKRQSNQTSSFKQKIELLRKNKFFDFVFRVFSKIGLLVFGILFFWTVPLFVFAKTQIQYFVKWLNIRENVIKFAFGFLFVLMIFNLYSLQVLGSTPFSLASNTKTFVKANNIIPAKKGNIYFRDLAQSREDVPLTSNSLRYNAVFNPLILKQNLPTITQNLKLK